MKKTTQFILGFLTLSLLTLGCKNGKLPNASITGATPWDYAPYGMMILGGLFLAFTVFNEVSNKEAYASGTKNPATKRFVFGVGGALLLIMGFIFQA